MSYPKKNPCPDCGAPGDTLATYRYDNGWNHVECDECHYFGPGGGSVTQAIKAHNLKPAFAPAEIDAAETGGE